MFYLLYEFLGACHAHCTIRDTERVFVVFTVYFALYSPRSGSRTIREWIVPSGWVLVEFWSFPGSHASFLLFFPKMYSKRTRKNLVQNFLKKPLFIDFIALLGIESVAQGAVHKPCGHIFGYF